MNSSHSILLFSTSTNTKNTVLAIPLSKTWLMQGGQHENKTTHNANKKANGIELFPEAVMIAEDTNGPMNADVFPICTIAVFRTIRNEIQGA